MSDNWPGMEPTARLAALGAAERELIKLASDAVMMAYHDLGLKEDTVPDHSDAHIKSAYDATWSAQTILMQIQELRSYRTDFKKLMKEQK